MRRFAFYAVLLAPRLVLAVSYGCVAHTPTPVIDCVPLPSGPCTITRIVGALPTPGTHITFRVDRTEVLSSECVIRPSLVTYTTSSNGALPVNTKLVAGSRVQVSLQNGPASEVIVPSVGIIDINQLLNSGSTPTSAPLTGIKVTGSSDFDLTVTQPWGYGDATLQPGAVSHFSLTKDGFAANNHITNIPLAMAKGDALSMGVPTGGDVVGTMPTINLVRPTLRGQGHVLAPQVLTAGQCATVDTTIAGAATGNTAAITPETNISGNVYWTAQVLSANTVRANFCAVANTTLDAHTFDIRVFQ